MAVLAPKEAGEWKAGGGPRVPQGKQETQDLKVHKDLKDYKAHRDQVEIVEGKETKEVKVIRDLRVLLGQQDPEGILEDLDLGGERGNLEFLEAQDQWGSLDSEESREIMASRAMVRQEEKELRAQQDSLGTQGRRVTLAILEFLGGLDPKDSRD